jgi:signal transduction histidine kinase/ActR/RegA family two-component response regulator
VGPFAEGSRGEAGPISRRQSSSWWAPRWTAYFAAIAGPALFSLLKLEIPALGVHRFLLLLLPVAVAAALRGIRPALLATSVSALMVDYLFTPPFGVQLNELGPLSVFVVEGVAISILFEGVHRRRQRLERTLAKEREQQRLLAETEVRLRAQIEEAELSRRKLSAEQGERKLAQEALHATEEQLRQAQKMEAIGRLAGGVAHDFNNLLSVILGYATLLETRAKDDESRQNAGEILAAGQRAADLTRQLLAFSRKQVLEPKVLDLDEVVAGTHKMLSRVLGEDIELEVQRSPELARVKCDPGQIEQVLVNLVLNARDAMPEGGTLRIRTSSVDFDASDSELPMGAKPGRYVMLSVEDSGIGMDTATARRIFEPFFTTKDTGKGTGLGLSTAFGIVKQSGGFISVQSELAKGSTFRVYLPETDAEPKPNIEMPKPVTRRGSEVVLLVEDEDRVRALAHKVLEEQGYRVLVARDGLDALALLERHDGEIHLLLADMVMPRMGGRELARRVAADRPAVRVLLASGYADDALTGRGVAFLQKPLDVDKLLDKVREVLDAPEGRFSASELFPD